MRVLVLGANGATGFNVVTQLIKHGIHVKALSRNEDVFDSLKNSEYLEVIKASISEIDNQLLLRYADDADAVISCLGHNISLKGIYGKPSTLVVDALKKIIGTTNAGRKGKTLKIILMNTTACLNKLQEEKFTNTESFVMKILRLLLPPHRDNELAIGYLIDKVGISNKQVEWIAVRPDTLINEPEVSEYTVHPSTLRSPVFDPGKTSRINVADFMVHLLKDAKLWEEWKYKTPVIYNRESKK